MKVNQDHVYVIWQLTNHDSSNEILLPAMMPNLYCYQGVTYKFQASLVT